MERRPIIAIWIIGNCPLHPLYKNGKVDRNEVADLAMCRCCEYYGGEGKDYVRCNIQERKKL